MSTPDAIAVLVSTSLHPLSGVPRPSRNDTLALEIARRLSGDAVRVLHAGDPGDPALADYLAFGGRVIEVLPAAPGDDIVGALAEQLRDARLILCGCRAQGGAASGTLPYLLAAALNRPVLADVLDVQLTADTVQTVQFLPKGRRRHVELSSPAIIAIHPLALVVPRYAYARRVAGRIETLPSANTRDPDAPLWHIDETERVPVKLKAPDRRTGHARMLAATVSAHRGGQVVNEGSNVEKAQAVLAYLREHDLIALPRKRRP
jgi:N,N-dimethylglycine/sarcosine catabolism electron transfer flavoprotein subunit beta